MNQSNDDFPFSPFPSDPAESISSPTINDPAFSFIFEYLRDFSRTTFDLVPTLNSSGADNSSASDTLTNLPVDYLQQLRTVVPICTLPTLNESQTLSQEPSEQQQQPTLQNDPSESRKINIKTQPRSKFRPRTEKESKDSSHYIRSGDYNKPGYPSIHIERSWSKQNIIIEVTLVDQEGQPHPYTIDNKERKTSSLIFKQNESNSLYFHVTEADYQQEEKIFLIEFIKPKQDNHITKELIKTRRLDQSILRFTLFYQLPDGKYQRDESSTEYSCLMTETYGDFTVEDVFPLYGPMCGNQKVCAELKGYIPKDLKNGLSIILTEDGNNWLHQITNIKKNRNHFTFSMPPFPNPQIIRAKINIFIQYKEQTICQSSYIYSRKLDEALVEPISTVPLLNTYGTLLACSSTEIRNTKRARQ